VLGRAGARKADERGSDGDRRNRCALHSPDLEEQYYETARERATSIVRKVLVASTAS
jgi:hypothetical protein